MRKPMVMRVLLLAGGLAACGARAERAEDGQGPANQPVAAAPELLVQLERGPCFGRCPEYEVGLFSDGRVQYRGGANSAVQGERTAQVPAAEVRRLHDALLAAGAALADSAYTVGHPQCTAYYTDLPSVVLTVRTPGGLRRIVHDTGCQGAPPYLSTFPSRIDSLAGTAPWVRGPSEKTP
ncbi:MAG: hypothetical protein KJT01_14595 [Gemmatimonadetes bacterium]|nr:hypothetical protein [Gemmatimonadota bacterium]